MMAVTAIVALQLWVCYLAVDLLMALAAAFELLTDAVIPGPSSSNTSSLQQQPAGEHYRCLFSKADGFQVSNCCSICSCFAASAHSAQPALPSPSCLAPRSAVD
jgi:hypothetical protein